MEVDHLGQFLRIALAADEDIRPIYEYLSAFDIRNASSKTEFVDFLTALCGDEKTSIIQTFADSYFDSALVTTKSVKTIKDKTAVRRGCFFDIAKKEGERSTPPSTIAEECGCMATRHAFSTSCLGCGRIMCDKEVGKGEVSAPFVCVFCGGVVYPPVTAEELRSRGAEDSVVAAYRQKDKLLMFDREHAKRTQVLDAQGDYYESSGNWLTEAERKALEEKDRRRRKNIEEKMSGRGPKTFTLDMESGKVLAFQAPDSEEDAVNEIIKPPQAIPRNFSSGSNRVHSGAITGSSNINKNSVNLPQDDSEEAEENAGMEYTERVRYTNLSPASSLENAILADQNSKAGEVYRLLRLGRVMKISGSDGSAASPISISDANLSVSRSDRRNSDAGHLRGGQVNDEHDTHIKAQGCSSDNFTAESTHSYMTKRRPVEDGKTKCFKS